MERGAEDQILKGAGSGDPPLQSLVNKIYMNFRMGELSYFPLLRIPDSYDAKVAKICKSACNSADILIDWITGQNVQRLQIFAILASYLSGNLKFFSQQLRLNLITPICQILSQANYHFQPPDSLNPPYISPPEVPPNDFPFSLHRICAAMGRMIWVGCRHRTQERFSCHILTFSEHSVSIIHTFSTHSQKKQLACDCIWS